MTAHNNNGEAGYTLVEVMVAVALVLLLASGLYATGLMVMRITHFNRVSIEARTLGLQFLEELSAKGKSSLVTMVPIPARTNYLQHGEEVVRNASVTGHLPDLSIATNLAASAYLELRVDVRYISPMTRAHVTNTFATLVD